jgi:hypothetical protein
MITNPKYPGRYLISSEELRTESAQGCPRGQAAFKQIRNWVAEFLCRPHADLGRSGPVCPFTAPSMRKQLFWMTAYRGTEISIEEATEVLLNYRDWFMELPPKTQPEANLKTILILFPEMSAEQAPGVVDVIQRELKPLFVEEGLMLGQFHQNCPEGGLWNPDFRPLQAPLPLLAIRHMVASDKPFLTHNETLMSSYRRQFDLPELCSH